MMETMQQRLKRCNDVKADFLYRGETVADWARHRGFSPQKVYDMLNGRTSGVRGESHKIAVALGLKEGIVS